MLGNQLTLIVDTSSDVGAVALLDESGLLASDHWNSQIGSGHSERLIDSTINLLKKKDLSLNDIGAVVVGNGPGSFTGIRVGLCFAKSLCFAKTCQIYVGSSFHFYLANFMAENFDRTFNNQDQVFIALYAFRNLVYCAKYNYSSSGNVQSWNLSDVISTEIDQLSKFVFGDSAEMKAGDIFITGDAVAKYPDHISNLRPENSKVHLLNMSAINLSHSLLLFKNGKPLSNYFLPSSWTNVSPAYVRDSEPEEKLKLK